MFVFALQGPLPRAGGVVGEETDWEVNERSLCRVYNSNGGRSVDGAQGI